MPEIAEAYNISKKLNRIKINKVRVLNSKILKNDISWIKDSEIKEIFNHGKIIIFKLSKNNKNKFLVSQLGMTGSWFNDYSRRDKKHNQLVLEEDKDNKLIYSDIRKFGNLKLYNNLDEVIKDKKYKLNLEKDNIVKIKKILENLNSDKKIKDLLLNQSYFTGIGNYLASEILFHSKINPHEKWNSIKNKKLDSLIKSIKYLIKVTKKYGGFSFYGGYILPDGSLGLYKEKALVYRKEKCPDCSKELIKEYINNRATYYCKNCQK